MAYTKQTWQDLPNTTTPINATNLNHIEQGIYDVSTTTATTSSNGLMSSSDKTKLNRIKKTNLLTGIVSTKTTITLNDNVGNYDFIIVVANNNAYGHRRVNNVLTDYFSDWVLQIIRYDETHCDNAIKIYGTTLDTNSSSLLGTENYQIVAIYGYKVS